MKVTCKDCGKEFTLTEGEIEFYKNKGLNLPKRCKECREANKASKPAQTGGNAAPARRSSSGGNNGAPGANYGKTPTSLPKKLAIVAVCALAFVGLFSLLGRLGDDEPVTEPVSAFTQETQAFTEGNTVTENFSYNEVTNTKPEVTENSEKDEPTEYVVSYYGGNEYSTKRYYFRNHKLLSQHYIKHGKSMGFSSEEAYEKAASDVITNKNALHKNEKEDNDDVYYIPETREFVVLSTDGYIRTYYYADRDYFERQ